MTRKILLLFFCMFFFSLVSPSQTSLYNLQIKVDTPVYFDNEFVVIVKPVDSENSTVQVNYSNIDIIDSIDYTPTNIEKLSNGNYKRSFVIPKQNITEFTIKTIFKQNQKTITEIEKFGITDKEFSIKDINETFKKLIIFIKDNWLYTLIFIAGIFLFGVLLAMIRAIR